MSDLEIIENDIREKLSPETKRLLLRNLKGLKSLDPISQCRQLKSIRFRCSTTVPSLTPLLACPSLTDLSFEGKTKVASFEPLAEMTQLRQLTVAGRLHEKLSGIKTSATHLYVESGTIQDLSCLADFGCLKQLELGTDTGVYTKVDDDTDFAPVRQIEQLFLMSRLMTSADALSVLTECRSLCIGSNKKLQDVSGLSALSQLEALAIDRTSVKTIEALGGLPLKYLSAGKTKLTKVDSVAMDGLIHLYLPGTRLKSFTENESLGKLELLSLANTPVKSIPGVASLPSLKYLSVSQCEKLTDFSPLKGLEALESIDLSGSTITLSQLTELFSLPKLQRVAIVDTEISGDATQLERASSLAAEKGVELVSESRGMHDFQYPHYRLMVFYLHAYLGDRNPWHDTWPTGYHV